MGLDHLDGEHCTLVEITQYKAAGPVSPGLVAPDVPAVWAAHSVCGSVQSLRITATTA